MIIVKSSFLKASEILLFFHKMKAGDFGGFYGTVDPLKVGESLNDFLDWRRLELDKVNNKTAQDKRERNHKEWNETAITREEYLARRST